MEFSDSLGFTTGAMEVTLLAELLDSGEINTGSGRSAGNATAVVVALAEPLDPGGVNTGSGLSA